MKGKNIAILIGGTLFILFLALYFTQTTGYYEYEMKRKATMTQEEILQFEKDIKEGKNVDSSKYLNTKEKDYDNTLSGISREISYQIEKALNKGLDYLFRSVDKVVNEK